MVSLSKSHDDIRKENIAFAIDGLINLGIINEEKLIEFAKSLSNVQKAYLSAQSTNSQVDKKNQKIDYL